jgi:hypothetical protein
VRNGYDPRVCGDALYFDDPAAGQFVPLNAELYWRIQSGAFKL